jgi:hypothetical protein
MDLDASGQFFSAMQGAGGDGFCTCNGADPLQTGVAVTSERLPGCADLHQWTGVV